MVAAAIAASLSDDGPKEAAHVGTASAFDALFQTDDVGSTFPHGTAAWSAVTPAASLWLQTQKTAKPAKAQLRCSIAIASRLMLVHSEASAAASASASAPLDSLGEFRYSGWLHSERPVYTRTTVTPPLLMPAAC